MRGMPEARLSQVCLRARRSIFSRITDIPQADLQALDTDSCATIIHEVEEASPEWYMSARFPRESPLIGFGMNHTDVISEAQVVQWYVRTGVDPFVPFRPRPIPLHSIYGPEHYRY